MDIHRCRFVPYPASAINALAFSHVSTNINSPAPTTLRLAIGRANGDIEIWDPKDGLWAQETILRGGEDRSIEGLAWTHDLESEDRDGKPMPGKLRLYSIGYSTVVTEWDLSKSRPRQHSTGNYGEIWCMSAQPRWRYHKDTNLAKREGAKAEQLLAIGCGDGTLVLLSTNDEELKYERTLPRPSGKKARVLSLAFQNRQKLVAGFSDSRIRIFDVYGRSQIINMSLGAGPKGGPSELLVWSVKCLPDGTIISGDSSGEVKIWDATTSTLAQRIQSHNADVLELSPSADGMTLLSGGMDRRTVLYKRRTEGKKKGRWMEVMHTRLHSSDVKAMSTFEAKNLNVTASGGLDCIPIIIPQGKIGQEHCRSLPTLPNNPPLDSAPSQRLLISWWDREVSVWQMGGSPETALGQIGSSQTRQLVAKILLQGEESIVSASITYNGRLLVVATITSIKLFCLRSRSKSHELKVSKMDLPECYNKAGARALKFSPDARWLLIVGPESNIRIHRLKEDKDAKGGIQVMEPAVTLIRRKVHASRARLAEGTHEDYMRSISCIAWSSDSKIVATCDLAGYLDAWTLTGQEDLTQIIPSNRQLNESMDEDSSSEDSGDESNFQEQSLTLLGQTWTRGPSQLPRLPSAPLLLSFRPLSSSSIPGKEDDSLASGSSRGGLHPDGLVGGEDRLLAVTIQHNLLEYSVMKGRLTDWTRRNPASCFPREFRTTRDRAIGCVWDISHIKQRLWLYGSTWLWMFDLSTDLNSSMDIATLTNSDTKNNSHSKKRKRGELEAERQELMKHTSGAGSKIPPELRTDGLGEGMISIQEDSRKWTSFDTHQRPGDSGRETDDYAESSSDESTSSDLIRMRRSLTQRTASAPKEVAIRSEDEGHGEPTATYWRTYKYRPILGIVPICSRGSVQTGDPGSTNLEVALVERPSWDLDTGPRWEGAQEWKR